jgi:hypothetical protein
LRNARASLPLEDEKFEQEEVEEESIIDQRPPHKAYHYLFHTHTVEEQLDQRFDEVPERDYVNVAYISNRSIDWIRDLQNMNPQNYSELEKTPPKNIDELMEKMNIVHYSDWSDTIKQELDQEELEELEDTFLVVKQPIEEIFDEESN